MLVVFEFEIDVFASESSFVTDVTVIKFLVVANRVAILLHSQFNYGKQFLFLRKVTPNNKKTASK